jgi:hypothetical protein
MVDDHMRTTDPSIYAAGNVSQHRDQVSGIWPVAVEQPKVAAENIKGVHEGCSWLVPVTTLKVAGIDLTSIGQFEARDPHEEEIVDEDTAAQRYRKLVLREGRARGAILLGARRHARGQRGGQAGGGHLAGRRRTAGRRLVSDQRLAPPRAVAVNQNAARAGRPSSAHLVIVEYRGRRNFFYGLDEQAVASGGEARVAYLGELLAVDGESQAGALARRLQLDALR